MKGDYTAVILEGYSACILMAKVQKQAVKTVCLYNITPEDVGSIFPQNISNTTHFHTASTPMGNTSRKTYSLQIIRNSIFVSPYHKLNHTQFIQ
jgi:hypothetical protein